MSRLFEPIQFRQTRLPNRIVVSPMCQYSADDGHPTAWHHAHLGGLALSGAGLLFFEATAISPAGRITPNDLGLWSDAHEASVGSLVNSLKAVSPIKLGIQLAHAGRKGSSAVPWEGGALISPSEGGWVTEAPSAIAHATGEAAPHALSESEIEAMVEAFAATARRAVRIGFDAIELHFAHGYLLHQFLSPVSNRRTDDYGGSLENRMRAPLAVFKAVRDAVASDIPVGVRVSATDWLEHLNEPSWTLEQTVKLVNALESLGCDWIDVSSGGISPAQKITVGPGYQVPFARQVKAATRLPVFAVGMITTPEQAETIIANGDADCVALARAMLYEPHWPYKAAAELKGVVAGPPQYWRCLPSGVGRIFGDTTVGMR